MKKQDDVMTALTARLTALIDDQERLLKAVRNEGSKSVPTGTRIGEAEMRRIGPISNTRWNYHRTACLKTIYD